MRRFAVMALAATLVWARPVFAYEHLGHKWNVTSVPYYINLTNIESLPNAGILSDVQAAADAWTTQASIGIRYQYAGTTTASGLNLDFKNIVYFRNDPTQGGALTYWWSDGSGFLVDIDITLNEALFPFFVGNSGCNNGIYVQNVLTHEFGHGLGLNHSTVDGATMIPLMTSYCDLTWESLEPDDIAGIEALYPPAAQPRVVLTKSSNPSSIARGGKTTFSIAYQNTGSRNATNVVITDFVPAGSSLVAGSIHAPSGVSFAVSGSTISWTVGSVTAGATAQSVSFEVTSQ